MYRIYADNAATTRLDRVAYEAMLPWLTEEYGNASQPYSFSRGPRKALAQARATIAESLGAEPEEIFFTSGGTESDNWVVKSALCSNDDNQRTITSAFEHHAILDSCATIERLGRRVLRLEPTNEGYVEPQSLEAKMTEPTRLVSVMFANNELGTIQPIQKLAAIARRHNALFHTDAVQAVGHVRINVRELGVDLLSASAHKFNGPKGVGFLYLRKGVELLPYANGGAQEKGKRAGTENVPAIVAMAAALKENLKNLENVEKRLEALENALLLRLEEKKIKFRRNGGKNKLPGLLSLSFPGADGEAMLHRLDLMGIAVSTGSACDSVNTEISHVLRAIRLDEELAKGTIRISLGKYNSEEDVENIADALGKILERK